MRQLKAILILLPVAAAWAQQSAPLSAGRLEGELKPCSVEGVLSNTTTGEALRKVLLVIHPPHWSRPGIQAMSGADGRFAFREVPSGRYQLYAQLNSGMVQYYGAQRAYRPGTILTLAPGCRVQGLDFRFVPPGAIEGVVRDEDGYPIMGASVFAIQGQQEWRDFHRHVASQATTNDRGEYRIYNLPTGRYRLLARGSRAVVEDGAMKNLQSAAFYPGTTLPGEAIAIEVLPGEELIGMDLELRPLLGARVRGRVLNTEALPQGQAAYVSLEPLEGDLGLAFLGHFGATSQGPAAEFEIENVPPGSYLLTARGQADQRSFAGRIQVVVDAADLEGLTVPLTPAVDIEGRVRAAGPDHLNFPSMYVTLVPVERGNAEGALGPVNSEGTFTLPNVHAGRYRLRLYGFPPEYYLESARLGGYDILDGGLVVDGVPVRGALDLLLTARGGHILGSVLSEGRPTSGALVVLVPDPPYRDRFEKYSVTHCDQSGRFSLPGLPPGEYKLFAWEEIDSEAYLNPDFLRLFEHLGTPVRVLEGNLSRMDLEIIPGEDEVR